MDVKFKILCNSYAKIYIKTSLDNYQKTHQLKMIFGVYRIRFIVDPNISEISYIIYSSEFYHLLRNHDHSQMIFHEHNGTRNLKLEKIRYEARKNKKWVNYLRRLWHVFLREKIVNYVDTI